MELWGLGDLTFGTPVIHEASRENDVHLLAKSYAKGLLHPSYPSLRFWSYDAPWTSYRGKYKLWNWKWPPLVSLIRRLRREKFDVAISVRSDPRDHFFMWMIGARRRYGFPIHGSSSFLTDPLKRSHPKQHKVEDWLDIGRALGISNVDKTGPKLRHQGYFSNTIDTLFGKIHKPVICLHAGARIPVRRWPEPFFAQTVARLREQFDFHLILVADPDGYGRNLAKLADTFIRRLSVRELVDLLGRVDLLLCNDSGPAHIASDLNRPTIPLFGPSDPDWFRPWGKIHKVIIRDICPWRPCKDYCKFSEPYCMTKLLPEVVWPEIRDQINSLIEQKVLPESMRKHKGEGTTNG